MEENKKNIIDAYKNGKSIPEISEETKQSKLFIYNYLKKHKVKLRRGGYRPRRPRKLKAPKPGPKVKPPETENEKWWSRVDSLIPDALDTLADALDATKTVKVGKDLYDEEPDHFIRVKAAEIILAKRIPDTKFIEHTGEDGGPIVIEWADESGEPFKIDAAEYDIPEDIDDDE